MAQYVIIGRDGAEGAQLRKQHRPAHLEYWNNLHNQGLMVYAGPLMDDDGMQPVGSLIIFEAVDRQAAETLMQGDPYVTGGVFASTELNLVRQVLPEP